MDGERPPPDVCPHCGVVIDPPPAGNRQCPGCRDPIVVRTRDGTQMLFTPDGAERYDRQRQEEYARNAARRRATQLGFDDGAWEAMEAEKAEEFGSRPSGGDVFWALANREAMEAAEADDWAWASQVYFQMALHLQYEDRPFHHIRQESLRCQVRDRVQTAAQLGWDDPVLQVLGVSDEDRGLCASDNGRRFRPEDLMGEDPPVPHDYGGEAWCPCSVELDRDAFAAPSRAGGTGASGSTGTGLIQRLLGWLDD